MPTGPKTIEEILEFTRKSQTNLGYPNDKFPEFLKYLIGGSTVRATFFTAHTAPGTQQVVLDILIIAGPTLINLTAYHNGSLTWSRSKLQSCISTQGESAGAVFVGAIVLGSALTIRFADELAKEGDVNSFLGEVANAAWGA